MGGGDEGAAVGSYHLTYCDEDVLVGRAAAGECTFLRARSDLDDSFLDALFVLDFMLPVLISVSISFACWRPLGGPHLCRAIAWR